MASQLAWNYFNLRGEPAVANGWTRRAHRMLDDLPPCAEQGHLAVTEGDAAIFGDDDPQSALGFARDAQRLGGLVGVAELEVLGLALEGLSLVSIGNMREGLSQLDEAAAAVTAGELDDLAAVGVTFCYLIFACEKARDYGRAGQWCERLRDLCERSGRNALLGVCRAHYAGVLTGAGEWQRAEAELERAAELLDRHAPGLAPERVLRLAELRRRQGRAEEAKRLYGEIEFHPHGLIGLAAVALDDDDALAAADLAKRVLSIIPESNRTDRSAAWELLMRACVATGDIDGAERALAELRPVAEAMATDQMLAAVSLGEGIIAAARGRHDLARRPLERAVELYFRCGAPFETAAARIELAESLTALDRHDEADVHLQRAREVLARLGATGILATLQAARRDSDGLSPREREVLELVAEGLSNREIARRLVLSEHTVHRHVANLLNKLGVSSRAAAVARVARHGR